MKIDMWAVKRELKLIGIIILILVGCSLGLNALGIHPSGGNSDYCGIHCG